MSRFSGSPSIKWALAVLVLPLALFGVACGGRSGSAASTAPAAAATATAPAAGIAQTENENEQTVRISVADWKITGPGGSPIAPVKAGEIRFDIENDGANVHEFVVLKSDADPASFPVVDGTIDEEAAGTSPGEVEDIQPGKSDIGTMRLSPGKYVLICNLPGHYQQGMHTEFIVE